MIARGPTLASGSNRARKYHGRYAMTSIEVLFNLPTMKKAKVRQKPIIWTDDEEEGILYPHDDALAIRLNVASREFNRILIDMGSSVDILFKLTLKEMRIANLKSEHTNTYLKGFGGGRLIPIRFVEVPVTIASRPSEKVIMLDFVVVEENSLYQMIFGHPFVRIS